MEQNKYPVTILVSDQLEEVKNDLTYSCHTRKIPFWLVLSDNVPTVILFTLGFIITFQLSTTGAIIYGSYTIFSVVWFWARICTFCHHYNTLACPCGYGVISSKLFKKRTDISFKKVFKRNIWIVFPNWFIPLAIAIYLMTIRYTKEMLVLTISFSLIGFVIIPTISKFVGCKNCEIKENCPWMTINKKD